MMDVSGAMTYGFYALMSILSGLFVWKFIPETKGKTLEELENVWKKESVTSVSNQDDKVQSNSEKIQSQSNSTS